VQVCDVTNGGEPLRNTYNELRLHGVHGQRSSSQVPAGDSRGNAAVAARQNALDSESRTLAPSGWLLQTGSIDVLLFVLFFGLIGGLFL
jgi:hypothetical protein